jgi:phenylacetate-CoA ligase
MDVKNLVFGLNTTERGHSPVFPIAHAKAYHADMLSYTPLQRRAFESLDRAALEKLQLEKLNQMLAAILPHNRFYEEKLGNCSLPITSLEAFSTWPFTFKEELARDLPPNQMAMNLTYPAEHYVRYHQTSGTRGKPMAVLDTANDWQWWIDTWQFVLDAAEIGSEDRVLMAFSFGPFIGFWSAFDAVMARGALAIPSGGMSTEQRLDLLQRTNATSLFCTPSYALHMAEVASQNQIDVAALGVHRIVVAGEPGGSLPSLRRRIETAWNARVVDHSGASEIGPWGYAATIANGLHIVESEFIAEFLSLETGQPAREGEVAEIVLTSLGRHGSPVIRYRTGDLARPTWSSVGANHFVFLPGGILGRADDMLIVRGVNVFPTGVEEILRGFAEVVEYRMIASKQGNMDTLTVEVEDRLQQPERIAKELHIRLGLTVDVRLVPMGSLPRFQGKGRRFVDQR